MKGGGSRKSSGSLVMKRPGIVLKGERGWSSDYFSEKRVCRRCFYKDALIKKNMWPGREILMIAGTLP